MTRGLSNPEVRSLRQGEKKIAFNRLFRKTTLAEFFSGFEDSHHFSTAIFQQSCLQSLKTAITSAVFDDSLSTQPSLKQSLMTAITSAVLSAVVEDSHHFGSVG